MKRERYIYLLLIPGILYFIIYRYVPMAGLIIAFQDYNPFAGFTDSEWVGFKHFSRMFDSSEVIQVIVNTLQLSLLQILVAFPISIVFALMLNDLRNETYK